MVVMTESDGQVTESPLDELQVIERGVSV